jgi:hypothetical protein
LESVDNNEPLYIGGHGDYRTVNNTRFWFHSYSPGIILNKTASKMLLTDNLMDNYNKLASNDLQNLSGVAIGYYANILNFRSINNSHFYYCNSLLAYMDSLSVSCLRLLCRIIGRKMFLKIFS